MTRLPEDQAFLYIILAMERLRGRTSWLEVCPCGATCHNSNTLVRRRQRQQEAGAIRRVGRGGAPICKAWVDRSWSLHHLGVARLQMAPIPLPTGSMKTWQACFWNHMHMHTTSTPEGGLLCFGSCHAPDEMRAHHDDMNEGHHHKRRHSSTCGTQNVQSHQGEVRGPTCAAAGTSRRWGAGARAGTRSANCGPRRWWAAHSN